MLDVLRFLVPAAIAAAGVQGANHSCKNIPGDPGWPSASSWAALNKTVGGRLIATVPAASVCHKKPYHDYNETACDDLKTVWDFPQAHFTYPSEIGSAWFQNGSCDPFTPASQPCRLGNYASYSINVTGAADVVAGVQFAKKNNVRLVIKNTGSDVLGRSTGKGSLLLWTFNLKTTQILPSYSASYYQGPAIRIGAGIMVEEAMSAADRQGYRLVVGSCPTIGVAGGYSQGGGHSALSSLYGLSADNVLEWEVVTADGRHVVAAPDNQYADLYWALSGGGAGNYAVVLSMTARLYPDGPIGGGLLAFNDSAVGADAFWDAVGAFHAALPGLLGDANTVSYGTLGNTFTTYSIAVPGAAGPGDVAAVFAPYLAELDARGVPYTFTTHLSPTFLAYYAHDFGPLPYGPFTDSQFVTSRLIPRAVVADPAANAALTAAIRDGTSSGNYYSLCQALNVSGKTPVAANAVLPAWRDAVSHCILVAPWDWTVPRSEMAAREADLAGPVTSALDAATPGSGTYMNEANFAQADWQANFFGSNYARLLQVKNQYDPQGLFYAIEAVGSEAWAPDAEGRLCRA